MKSACWLFLVAVLLCDCASNQSQRPTSPGTPAQAQQVVTLKWDASKSAQIAGYNVYRGTDNGGPYSLLLNNQPVTALTFVDDTVLSGQVYYYVVTAVSVEGVQ